jgi:hypothetical protein
VIEVCELTRRYGAKTAVDDLTFVVQPGIVMGFPGSTARGSPRAHRRDTFALPMTKQRSPCGQFRGAVMTSASVDVGLVVGWPNKPRRVACSLRRPRHRRSRAEACPLRVLGRNGHARYDQTGNSS